MVDRERQVLQCLLRRFLLANRRQIEYGQQLGHVHWIGLSVDSPALIWDPWWSICASRKWSIYCQAVILWAFDETLHPQILFALHAFTFGQHPCIFDGCPWRRQMTASLLAVASISFGSSSKPRMTFQRFQTFVHIPIRNILIVRSGHKFARWQNSITTAWPTA